MSKQCGPCYQKVLLHLLSAALGGAIVYGAMSCRRGDDSYKMVSTESEDEKSEVETSTDAVIEHSKPLAERTYEQKKLLSEYLLMHFGEEVSGKFVELIDGDSTHHQMVLGNLPAASFGDFSIANATDLHLEAPQFPTYALNFPSRVAHFASQFASAKGRALDIGCAVGRTAFELSANFESVVGIDYSFAFIEAAQKLAQGVALEYQVPVEGSITYTATATLGPQVRPDACQFFQGDATALDESLGKFDCIVAANLIDRLPSPRKFVESVKNFLNQGGILFLTSPYTWLSEFTPKSEWLGGYTDENNKPVSTYDSLVQMFTESGDFELLQQFHMPFLIRETARKNQFTYAHATVWKKL